MKKAKLALLVTLSIALLLLVAQNTDPVHARFLWLTAEVPAIILLFLTAAGGFVAGLLVALLVKRNPQARSNDGRNG